MTSVQGQKITFKKVRNNLCIGPKNYFCSGSENDFSTGSNKSFNKVRKWPLYNWYKFMDLQVVIKYKDYV